MNLVRNIVCYILLIVFFSVVNTIGWASIGFMIAQMLAYILIITATTNGEPDWLSWEKFVVSVISSQWSGFVVAVLAKLKPKLFSDLIKSNSWLDLLIYLFIILALVFWILQLTDGIFISFAPWILVGAFCWFCTRLLIWLVN